MFTDDLFAEIDQIMASASGQMSHLTPIAHGSPPPVPMSDTEDEVGGGHTRQPSELLQPTHEQLAILQGLGIESGAPCEANLQTSVIESTHMTILHGLGVDVDAGDGQPPATATPAVPAGWDGAGDYVLTRAQLNTAVAMACHDEDPEPTDNGDISYVPDRLSEYSGDIVLRQSQLSRVGSERHEPSVPTTEQSPDQKPPEHSDGSGEDICIKTSASAPPSRAELAVGTWKWTEQGCPEPSAVSCEDRLDDSEDGIAPSTSTLQTSIVPNKPIVAQINGAPTAASDEEGSDMRSDARSMDRVEQDIFAQISSIKEQLQDDSELLDTQTQTLSSRVLELAYPAAYERAVGPIKARMIHNQVKCCALCKLLYGIDATQTTKEGLALAQLYLDQGLVEQAASHLSQIKGTWRQIRFRYAHGWQDGTSSGSCPSVSLTATLLRIEAELELSKRNIEAARKCLDRAEQLYPSPRSWELYARSFCTSSGDPWESIRWYTKVLEKESRDGNIREEIRIHKMLGVIYLDRTDVEGQAAAETHFQTALALTSSRFGPESDATHRLELDIAHACLQKGALQFGMAPALKLAAFLDEHLTQGHDANVSWRFVKDMTWQYHMEIGDFGQARRIVSEIRRKQTLAMPHIAALVDKRRETELDLMEAMALSRGGYERSALKILAKVDSRVILKSQKLRARLKMVLASITEQALVAFMLRSKPELLSCCGVTQPSTASPAWNKYSQPVRELRRPSEI